MVYAHNNRFTGNIITANAQTNLPKINANGYKLNTRINFDNNAKLVCFLRPLGCAEKQWILNDDTL